MINESMQIRVSIDRGGTFTDVHASVPGKKDIVLKLLSVDPSNYRDAPTEGIRRVLELATGTPHPKGVQIDLFHIHSIRMGTTIATNALLQRQGAKSALLITRGLKDLLFIGNQARPDIFDLSVTRPTMLYEEAVEIDERITMEDYAEDPYCQCTAPNGTDLVAGNTGETVRIIQKPDPAAVKMVLQRLWNNGYRSISVVFLHSYAYPQHELLVGEIALSMGFSVTLSSKVQPMIKVVPRGMSATIDAYLTPVVKDYLEQISGNFNGGLDSRQLDCKFMQSDGSLANFHNFGGLRAILSGPAGGVVGYAQTSWDERERRPIIGFDMGGTSTDISRYNGIYEHIFETSTAGVPIQSPQLDIRTIAAGGGSILTWRNGLFNVGPESASAHPGPACYRKGGPLTITDANLFLGRLLPEHFPKIFGRNEDLPPDTEVTVRKFLTLTAAINVEQQRRSLKEFSPEEVALGFIDVANESMARAIRTITEARGYEPSTHHLACFGGAGGQHACMVATALGIPRVILHKYSSVLSAYGMSLADVVHEAQRPAATTYSSETHDYIRNQLDELTRETSAVLQEQGFSEDHMRFELFLNMRYTGSSTSFMILADEQLDFQSEFEKRHHREFGFLFREKAIIVDDIRVRAVGNAKCTSEMSPSAQLEAIVGKSKAIAAADSTSKVYFPHCGYVETSVYSLTKLSLGMKIPGPAIVVDQTQTIVVTPGWVATILTSCIIIDMANKVKIDKPKSANEEAPKQFSPIQLSIFGHRFMSIAEQMGRVLQKTAVSTNIKERLDFSCALFTPDGGLVANAPHVPVHLGSMQFAVRYQHNRWKGCLHKGDMLVSNHPSCGGTHLPDITVITPVFDEESNKIVFYTASRGHHADIGGILPGSMPPNSTELWQEGSAIEAEKIVEAGTFNEAAMVRLLLLQPAKYEECSGTRKIADNISDLKAQIAANQKGNELIKSLISEFGLHCVHRYMYAIQKTAEVAVREVFKSIYETHGPTLKATDYMDDGTPIVLKITVNPTGSAVFDFDGTGPQVYGNTNAPVAITHSAIIYCLRALISSEIPLNEGCLAPVDILIPQNSLLSPANGVAVVGGNVLTSQRITDVVLLALRACAASQGCTNNLTFGTGGKDASGNHVEGFGYYETITGGAGAGSSWHGQSGVHTHMTNTRITDPEILEKRYPVILRQFTLRKGSGGRGKFSGGEGVIREIEFTAPVQCSIISERRSRQPYGMEGGGNGAAGINLVIRKDRTTGEERTVNLGAKATVKLSKGEKIIVHTPGGGGYGMLD